MRTFRALPGIVLLGALSIVASPTLAFNPTAEIDTPADAFWFGYSAYQNGDLTTAMDAIQYAAEQGYTRALWMLGHMYANGEGVSRDDQRAFEIFAGIATNHGQENPRGADAPFVADAVVMLGDYYRDGRGMSHPDLERARQWYLHAATFFGDDEAQFELAQMFYDGDLGEVDPVQAVRWARLAAENGNAAAQALLGHLLFEGEGVSRQPVLGLAYLTIALEAAGSQDDELRRMHQEAWLVATEAERRTAQVLAEGWLADAAGIAAAATPAAAGVTTDAILPAAVPQPAAAGAGLR
jgi:TPR repeat protein